MSFLPQPGEIETNDDLYESSDEEYKNRLRLGSFMIRVLAKYRPPPILMIFHLRTNLSPKRTNLKVIFT